MEENISFDPCIRTVEVKQVVITSFKNIVDEVNDRAGAVATGEVHRIIVARHTTEKVPDKNTMATGSNPERPVDGFNRGGGRREMTMTHDKGRAVEVKVAAIRCSKGEMIEVDLSTLHADR